MQKFLIFYYNWKTLVYWLISWIGFYAISVTFQPYTAATINNQSTEVLKAEPSWLIVRLSVYFLPVRVFYIYIEPPFHTKGWPILNINHLPFIVTSFQISGIYRHQTRWLLLCDPHSKRSKLSDYDWWIDCFVFWPII